MDAFSIAADVLGGASPTPEQLAQLRAIEHRHQQQLYELEQSRGSAREAAAAAADLEARLAADVRELLATAG